MSSPTLLTTASADFENTQDNLSDNEVSSTSVIDINTMIDIALIGLTFVVIFLCIYCIFYIKKGTPDHDKDNESVAEPQISVAVMTDNKAYNYRKSIESEQKRIEQKNTQVTFTPNPYVHTKTVTADSVATWSDTKNTKYHHSAQTSAQSIDDIATVTPESIATVSVYHHSAQASAQSIDDIGVIMTDAGATVTEEDIQRAPHHRVQISAQSTVLHIKDTDPGGSTSHHQKTYSGVSVASRDTVLSNRSEGRVKVGGYNFKRMGEDTQTQFVLYENQESNVDTNQYATPNMNVKKEVDQLIQYNHINALQVLPHATPMDTSTSGNDTDIGNNKTKTECIARPMPSTQGNYTKTGYRKHMSL